MSTTTREAPPRRRAPAGPHRASGPELPALRLVHAPVFARRMAKLLLILFVLTPVGLAFIPWQQSLSASGRLIAFDPSDRQQSVEAPIEGRILKWHKVEGDPVRGPVIRPKARAVLKPDDLEVVGGVAEVRPGDRIKVRAFDEDDRPIELDHTVRPGEQIVLEDEVVRPGDVLVSLRDANVNLASDLAAENRAVRERLRQARDRVVSFERQIGKLRTAQEEAIKGATERLQMGRKRIVSARERVTSARASYEAAKQNLDIQNDLFQKKLAAKLEVISAQQRHENTLADWNSNKAALEAADAEVNALDADLARVRNDTEAAIQGVTALRQAAEADAYTAVRDLVGVKVRQRRQATQEVTAPCDGVLFRVASNAAQGGAYVKSGDLLGSVVPTPEPNKERRRVVELYVDGNDMPFITEFWRKQQRELEATGQADEKPYVPVRLQFEGWPAIQFVGWPSVAVGTFGGRLVLVDAHDDGTGKFRVLIEPDPAEEQDPNTRWPEDFSLRQGVRAQGWVLLNQVPLYYELWRRINGFPPVVAGENPDKGDKAAKK